MKRILFVLSVVTALVFLSNDVCSAGGRKGILRRQFTPHPHRAPQTVNHGYHNNPSAYYRELYPKYYGAFHARSLYNYGVPSGDVGLRGNGVYWTPW